MPIYEYAPIDPSQCNQQCGRFEVVQSMTEPALAVCPTCGIAVQRVFSTTAIHGAASSANTMSNKNLAAQGFTKYVKAGDGHYERVAGDKGPQVIKR